MDNSEKTIEYIIDSWNQNKCVVLIESLLSVDIITDQLRKAQVSECVIDKNLKERFTRNERVIAFFNAEKIDYKYCDNHAKYTFICQKIVDKFVPRYDKSDALILFSSGSSGIPKGVILSHFAININADNIISYLDLQKDDSVFITKSICHSSTMIGEVLVCLKNKTPIYIGAKQVSPLWQLRKVIELRTTIFFTNPKLLKIYIKILEKDKISISDIRKIYSSGSILTDSIKKKAKKIFVNAQIYNAYGLTECGPRVCVQTNKNDAMSVGYPIKDVSIKIIDSLGNYAAKGTIGEVCVKTPSIFSGYVDNSKKWITNDWLLTNDLGYFDMYNQLVIVGRKDNVVNINGYKILIERIENVFESCQEIDEAIVVPMNHNEIDYLVCIYSGIELDEISLKEKFSNILAAREIPRKFYYLNAVPINVNRKKDRKQAKKIVSALIHN